MRVIVAQHAGFCWGVKRVVQMTEALAAARRQPLYTYGPLIHNPAVIQRLAAAGVKILKSGITPEELAALEPHAVVIIRAHGVPPHEHAKLTDAGVEVVDGTCPHVHTIQQKVAAACSAGRTVVILGDKGHAEVVGLLGFCPARGLVVGTVEEARQIPLEEPLSVVAQSTLDARTFGELTAWITRHAADVEILDTRCGATARTQDEAIALCGSVDIMVVVGGRNSANTNRLVHLCRAQGVPAVHVETADELRRADFAGKHSAGVTAGSSTPDWITAEVVARLQSW